MGTNRPFSDRAVCPEKGLSPVPETVTTVPAAPELGEKPVIATDPLTTNDSAEVTESLAVVTDIVPVLALVGTITVS